LLTAPPSIRVQLFGELDLRMGGERLPALESARARSLLAFLLLHDDAPRSRHRLAFLLWPDSTEGQARTNLRHLLHTLRRASPELDQFLEVTPQILRWRREVPCWIDVEAFEGALARADAAGVGAADTLDALREAIGLYSGDLLEGDYEDWLIEIRERLRDRYLAAIPRAAVLLADAGDHAEAIRLGRDLLRCDPLREDTYRLMMRLLRDAGDRAGAVRVYHECVTTLQGELGVVPSAATTEAYAALIRSVRGEPSERPSAPTEPDLIPIRGAALVGRDREWERLTSWWRDAERGRVQLVLVTGEPGVGKTRLVEELASWCAHRGAVVAQARSYPTEGELGYGVVISWLRSDDVAAHIRRAAPTDRAELARLLPELADDSFTAAPIEEAEQRRRLFDAVARTVVASGRPTLLIADDAQWCDAQSLQLIHYLVRLDAVGPLLVVGTVRREELDEGHPLDAVASGLQLIDRAGEIALERLTRAGTEELARHLAGDLDAVRVDELHRETEGNPLFIVERLRAGWDGGDASSLAPKVQAVISARLGRLSAPALDLVGLAATVGREFTADVLAGASAMDDVTLVRGLDELWRRGIIRERGTDAYDFAHGRIRDVAYERLSPAGRRRNHLLVAGVLLQIHDRDPDAVSGEVGRHFDRGGQVDDAVRWYQRAAVQAQRLHADVEAVRLLDRAVELVAALPESSQRADRELEVLSSLPTPLAVVEGFASTRMVETQRRLLELAGIVGAEPEPSLLRSLAMTNLCRKDFDGARIVARRLHRLAHDGGDDVLLVESEYLLGIGAFWDGAFVTAREHFERVGNRFRSEQRVDYLLRFGQDPSIVGLSRLANTLWFLGHRNDARRVRDDALAMADEVGYPFSRGVAYVFAALLSVDLGEPGRYQGYVAALASDAQHAPLQIAADAFLGYAEVLDGRALDGIRRIRRAIDTGPVDHAPGQGATHHRLLVAAHDVAGDASGGLAAADEALRAAGSRIWEAEHRRLRATFLAALGASSNEVDAELTRAAAVARRQGALGLERRVERTRSRVRPP
jgi:DNA-binding SARP family transcriptional activator